MGVLHLILETYYKYDYIYILLQNTNMKPKNETRNHTNLCYSYMSCAFPKFDWHFDMATFPCYHQGNLKFYQHLKWLTKQNERALPRCNIGP